ncbi:MAG: MCE family protein [Hyphomicrobiaceae bacterium]|nr:MAG: MCE family protein [Hyphomicrobiaceae bacterium]
MEIRARYIQMGLFTLAVIAAVFFFVYWLHNTGGLRERALYRIRFENTVSGLLTGSGVFFNGIRVGEVTALDLNAQNPRQIMVTIAVEPATPVRADTQAEIDFQGLAGSAVISLKGGSPTAPALAGPRGAPPLIVADAAATQSMTQTARDVLRRFDAILAENSDPLRGTLANLNTFSEALARNSNRVDGIIAGLERFVGGAAKGPSVIYDISAPRTFPPLDKPAHGQLVVPEPTTLIALDTQKILVRPTAPDTPSFANAQWGDSTSKLFQAKIIQSFENANYLSAVGRPVDGLTADYQLLIDIRSFQISTTPEIVASVEFAAKILATSGRIVDARTFRASLPAQITDAAAAAAGLDQAFGKAVTELVVWTANALRTPPAKR